VHLETKTRILETLNKEQKPERDRHQIDHFNNDGDGKLHVKQLGKSIICEGGGQLPRPSV